MHTEPKPSHGSAEWLAVRHRDPQGRARLTASVASVLIPDPGSRTGCANPFMAPADLATQMLAEMPPEPRWSPQIQRGHDLEPVLLNAWQRETGGRLETPPVMFSNGRWLANLDGVGSFGPNFSHPVEAKTTDKYADEILPYWYWQAVAQAYCFHGGAGRVDFVWYDAQIIPKFATVMVPQHDVDRLVAAGEEWLSYIDLDMVPPPVVLSAQQVATLNPKPELAKTELPEEAWVWIDDLRNARHAAKKAKDLEDEAKAKLAPLLANADVGIWNGREAVSWKASKDRTSFDAARFQAEHPDLWQQYQKTSPGARTMRILKGFDEMGDGDDGTDDEPF